MRSVRMLGLILLCVGLGLMLNLTTRADVNKECTGKVSGCCDPQCNTTCIVPGVSCCDFAPIDYLTCVAGTGNCTTVQVACCTVRNFNATDTCQNNVCVNGLLLSTGTMTLPGCNP